jgi:hypothetical protein
MFMLAVRERGSPSPFVPPAVLADADDLTSDVTGINIANYATTHLGDDQE